MAPAQRSKSTAERRDTKNAYRNDEESSETQLWGSVLSRFAIGDSEFALLASFAMLLVAVAIALWLQMDDHLATNLPAKTIASLGPVPEMDPPFIFQVKEGETVVSDEIRHAFEKDGVVAVRGLLSEQQIRSLELGAAKLVDEQIRADQKRKRKRSGTQFHTVHVGAVFSSPPTSQDDDTEMNDAGASFREVALFSAIPKYAADLLQLREDRNDTLRLLRDIFLAKDEEQYICGWHVDDTGFWPATAKSPGVNAWIAIDDMPVERGGGFALAVGSHTAAWRDEAYHVTGATMTNPAEGFRNAADMFANRTGSGTCNLKTSAPHLHQRMEDTKRIYSVRRGDILFHTRWLFHRTVSFNRDQLEEDGEHIYRRYSIRYGPGTSVIPPGYGTELSVLWNEENAGRTADDVAVFDGPWYPQCWPHVKSEEIQHLQALIENKLPVAEERRKARRSEMKPYLSKLARKDNHWDISAYKSQH